MQIWKKAIDDVILAFSCYKELPDPGSVQPLYLDSQQVDLFQHFSSNSSDSRRTDLRVATGGEPPPPPRLVFLISVNDAGLCDL